MGMPVAALIFFIRYNIMSDFSTLTVRVLPQRVFTKIRILLIMSGFTGKRSVELS
jgi:hypothetical protein